MSVRRTGLDRRQLAELVDASLRLVESRAPAMSARRRLSAGQTVAGTLLVGLVAAGMLLAPVGTLVVVVSVCTLTYLATVAHRVAAFRASLRGGAVEVIPAEAARAIPDDELPSYAVLLPVFREPEVIDQLVGALEAIEYPAEKLAVKLLLEEGDDATLDRALAIETSLDVEVLVLPPGGPQTKPRALNVGLLASESELVTIYDAEDLPEPLQLRRAAAALAGGPPGLACVQARLDFYDCDRNLIAKWFTVEYLTWFRHYLPGMVHQRGVVPLGGTSNHFRRDALLAVGAWDPYNVTEDADLGIRLQRFGYDVGIVDSVTSEEANSDLVNWVRQRSRWQKGFLQTALVHTRSPLRTRRELGSRGLVHLLLFVGGTPLLALGNLAFWATSLLWVLSRAHFIEVLFPGVLFYLAVGAWMVGNLAIIYLGLLTLAESGRGDLLGAALLAPLYWIVMSVAALRATIQLVVDPFHWEKTTHGLAEASTTVHLGESPSSDPHVRIG